MVVAGGIGASDIHADYIAVAYRRVIRLLPYHEIAVLLLNEADVLQHTLAPSLLADEPSVPDRLPAERSQCLYLIDVEDMLTCRLEGFHIGGRSLVSHLAISCEVSSLVPVPIDTLKGRTESPKPPIVFSGILPCTFRLLVL